MRNQQEIRGEKERRGRRYQRGRRDCTVKREGRKRKEREGRERKKIGRDERLIDERGIGKRERKKKGNRDKRLHFYVYLTVAEALVSVVLIREEARKQ